MSLPSADTPLYNHPLPEIEQWLISRGCSRDPEDVHCWRVDQPEWSAAIWMEIDSLLVRYFNKLGEQQEVQRSFKYSLSRRDMEAAIFSGP